MLGAVRKLVDKEFNNFWVRDAFVKEQLAFLAKGSTLLDAGAGSQQFKKYAEHLDYVSQDFNSYKSDETKSFSGLETTYEYGKTDIVGNIWEIDVAGETFDAVLCTEVLEHVPYPIETVKELGRVTKPGGRLILTAPSNCLRHFDPFFFSSGYSDRWYETILPEAGFQIESITPVGDYFSWMKVEVFRTITIRPASALFLLPALVYFKLRRKNAESVASLCMGYHVVATKMTTPNKAL